MRFIVYSPPYRLASGGVKALHGLCRRLRDRGHESWIYSWEDRVEMSVPHGGVEGPVVAVYPEVVEGNPLETDRVVRWILNRPGKASPDKSETWGDNEPHFYWSAYFVDNPDPKMRLTFPMLDRSIFNNRNNPFDKVRRGSLTYSGKYVGAGNVVPEGMGIELCGVPLTRIQMAEILRRFKVLHLFEASVMSEEATACGCEVKYVLSDYMPTVPTYERVPDFSDVDRFVKTCEERFGAH